MDSVLAFSLRPLLPSSWAQSCEDADASQCSASPTHPDSQEEGNEHRKDYSKLYRRQRDHQIIVVRETFIHGHETRLDLSAWLGPGNRSAAVDRPSPSPHQEGGMSRYGKTRNWIALLAMTMAIALVFAACNSQEGAGFDETSRLLTNAQTSGTATDSGGDDGGEGIGSSDVPESTEGADQQADRLGDGGVEPVVFQVSDLGRDIIFTADLTVAVTDVGTAGDEATRQIQSLGGFLFGQRTTGTPEPRSILTFKVQPEDFHTALERLGTIGELRSQNVTADDVTERIVDLESRITTATASVDRLRNLLAQATDIKAIVELESELLVRETELETLRGSLRTLQDQVALATIVLTLTEAASNPSLDVMVTAYPAHDDGASCPGDDQLTVEQDTEATVCFEIVNIGDTWLTDFELRDPVLDIEMDDLIVVFGDPSDAIEPGESIVLAAEILPGRDLRARTTVTALPVDESGSELPGRPASSTATFLIAAADPGGLPTFGEGLQASWDLLAKLGQFIVLMVGALIPFVWVPVIIWLLLRVWRRRPVRPQTD